MSVAVGGSAGFFGGVGPFVGGGVGASSGGGSSGSSNVATASGYIALLQEDDATVKKYALQKLLDCVDTLWHEVAECLPDLEAIAEGDAGAGGGGGGGDDADGDVDMAAGSAAAAASEPIPEPIRKLAAAVASRVFFHLDEPTQALRLALDAGPEHFDPDQKTVTSPYVEKLVSAALDAYVAKKKRQWDAEGGVGGVEEGSDEKKKMGEGEDGRDGGKDGEDVGISIELLRGMVYRLLESSCAAGKFEHALGIALEARETSKVRDIIVAAESDDGKTKKKRRSPPPPAKKTGQRQQQQRTTTTTTPPSTNFIRYAYATCSAAVTSKSFRQEALQVIADCLTEKLARLGGEGGGGDTETTYDLVVVLQLLGQPHPVADVLMRLLAPGGEPSSSPSSSSGDGGAGTNDGEDKSLLALQLCFDLVDSGDQAFVAAVSDHLAVLYGNYVAASSSSSASQQQEGGVVVGGSKNEVLQRRMEQANKILTNGFTSELKLSFLHKQNNTDRNIMENVKKSLEDRSSGSSRNSVLHNSAVLTHSYLYAGTTNDSFLRDYLDWMKKASNWAKFSATASLGVIHAAHVSEAMHLLEPYLPSAPSEGNAVSPAGGYAEGGSLYALGLVHGSQTGTSLSKKREACDYIRNHLRASHANEVISHGAALGVGLTAMGTADVAVVNELKEVLDTDSAVAGEAAGIAIGLVLVGTGAGNVRNNTLPPFLSAPQKEEIHEIVAELKNYARETQHEKIIRGIAMGLAVMNYGQEENADVVVEEMRSDRDPVMRYGAQYALSLAYCGTGSNKAIRILLHTAVSDVSDDVRMAAVIGLSFVLYKTPERVPQLVKLLLESFNPHVRYASCVAVGIAMAGTGDTDSIAMLEPMLDDVTDYVRQGALMGTAMIYMQQSDSCNGRKIRSFRDKLAAIITEKHQSTLTKMGAILSTGIIDAGGRNCSLMLGSRNGFTRMSSAVGLALWLQHWHWFPMMHMFGMALTPTYTIGLNKDFKYPKKHFEIVCHSKPSAYAYPKKLEEKKEEKKKRVETVTLSTTAKEKARKARKRAKMGGGGGGVAAAAAGSVGADGSAAAAVGMEIDQPAGSMEEDDKAAGGGDDKKTEEGEAAMTTTTKEDSGDAMDVDKEEGEAKAASAAVKKPAKKERKPEPTSFRVGNPARITKSQSMACEFDLTQRYRPIRPGERPFGVIMLTDSTPDVEEDELGAVKAPSLEPEGELAPPEPFEWTPPPPPTTTTTGGGGDTEETAMSSSSDAAGGGGGAESSGDDAATKEDN